MSKRIPFLFFIILIMLMPLPQAEALGIGPPSFELDLYMDGSNSTTIYLLSDGLEGELVIGIENLPFRLEPSRINMSKEDNYRPVELTFYGNETLEPGVYEGMVTFVAQTGGFVAMGIKIRAKINLLGEAQEIQEEESETGTDISIQFITEPESEEEPETIAEEEESEEEEPEIESEESESEEEDDDESQKSIIPYIMVGMIGVALAAIVLIVWWKRR